MTRTNKTKNTVAKKTPAKKAPVKGTAKPELKAPAKGTAKTTAKGTAKSEEKVPSAKRLDYTTLRLDPGNVRFHVSRCYVFKNKGPQKEFVRLLESGDFDLDVGYVEVDNRVILINTDPEILPESVTNPKPKAETAKEKRARYHVELAKKAKGMSKAQLLALVTKGIKIK